MVVDFEEKDHGCVVLIPRYNCTGKRLPMWVSFESREAEREERHELVQSRCVFLPDELLV